MKKVCLAIIWVVLFYSYATAQITVQCDDGVKVDILAPRGVLLNESVRDVKWIRGVSGDFEIISLDNEKGAFIEKKINGIKKEMLPKWGFNDVKLSATVRIMVVDDAETMKRLFRLSETRVEPFREHNDETIHIVYLVVEDTPAKTLNKALTELMLAEWAKKNSVNVGFWAKRGMSQLSLPVDDVKRVLIKSIRTNPSSDKLFGMTEDKWKALDKEDRDLFDSQCAILALMIRKEFGEDNLHKLIKNDPKKAIVEVFRFSDSDHFDRSYQRFLSDILREIKENKTPDHYLKITPAR